MNEKPDFEQNYFSRTAMGKYKIVYGSITSRKVLADYDRIYEILKLFQFDGICFDLYN